MSIWSVLQNIHSSAQIIFDDTLCLSDFIILSNFSYVTPGVFFATAVSELQNLDRRHGNTFGKPLRETVLISGVSKQNKTPACGQNRLWKSNRVHFAQTGSTIQSLCSGYWEQRKRTRAGKPEHAALGFHRAVSAEADPNGKVPRVSGLEAMLPKRSLVPSRLPRLHRS
ncbi:uncharacterized protein LOC144614305 [Panthera onca]